MEELTVLNADDNIDLRTIIISNPTELAPQAETTLCLGERKTTRNVNYFYDYVRLATRDSVPHDAYVLRLSKKEMKESLPALSALLYFQNIILIHRYEKKQYKIKKKYIYNYNKMLILCYILFLLFHKLLIYGKII